MFRHVIGLWSACSVNPSLELNTLRPMTIQSGILSLPSIMDHIFTLRRELVFGGFPACHSPYRMVPPTIPTYWWTICEPVPCPILLYLPLQIFQCRMSRVMLAPLLPNSSQNSLISSTLASCLHPFVPLSWGLWLRGPCSLKSVRAFIRASLFLSLASLI